MTAQPSTHLYEYKLRMATTCVLIWLSENRDTESHTHTHTESFLLHKGHLKQEEKSPFIFNSKSLTGLWRGSNEILHLEIKTPPHLSLTVHEQSTEVQPKITTPITVQKLLTLTWRIYIISHLLQSQTCTCADSSRLRSWLNMDWCALHVTQQKNHRQSFDFDPSTTNWVSLGF